MYHQILHVGEESVPCVVEYVIEDGGVYINKIIIVGGNEVPVGIFETEAIEDMTHRLTKGHDRVISDLDAEYRADRAQNRDAFRAAYGD